LVAVTSLWRHPIKSHGREALAFVDLVAGQSMPWDRHWAVTHADTKFSTSDPAWVMCRNFMIGSMIPRLAGIWADFDETTREITLRHADLPEITFAPDSPADVTRFLTWVTPLSPADKRHPTGVVSLGNQGITDTDYPSISILNMASHADVARHLGNPLEIARWRGNIWLDGMSAWQEWDWVGRDIQIGQTVLRIKEPITRCMHTTVNPNTGERDVDTLAVLRDNWDHQNFGIYAEVIRGGNISLGDTAEVL